MSGYSPAPGSVRIQKPKPRAPKSALPVDTRSPSGRPLPF